MDTAGTASDDTIFGTEDDDRLKGKEGDDIIYGQGGDDWINGNRDDDTLFGGDGDDTLVGYSGDDELVGGQGGPSTTGHDMLLGHSGDDILRMASTDGDGMANGGVGNDEYHLTAMAGLGQYHTFEVGGSDTFNLKFDSITNFSHGHHIRGDKNGETSADIFDFQDTSQVSDVVVGRLEDFDPSRDKIAIEGNTLDLGNLPDGIRIVDFDVDPTDTAVGKQQWLLIETEAEGHIFYASHLYATNK
jgi:Ca2+-binding RTX toxin-like protein